MVWYWMFNSVRPSLMVTVQLLPVFFRVPTMQSIHPADRELYLMMVAAGREPFEIVFVSSESYL